MKPERLLVRDAFARAAQRYDAVADFQREAGRRLLDRCAGIEAPVCVLDAGCGTGHGLGLLAERWPEAQAIALDFAFPMLARLPVHAPAVCADIEKLPLQDESIDMVWSNLALQWCDLGRVAAEFRRVLRRGGYVVATTLGQGTFAELRRAFAGVDGFRHTNDFLDETMLRATLRQSGFGNVDLQRVAITCHYPDLRTLLASVRDLGANRVAPGNRRPGLMGKAAWRRFVENYERMSTPRGLPLTYDTCFILAGKT